MRRAILLGMLFLVAAVGTASADIWDSRGWTMLGERSVNGRVDRDRIDVGRYEGRFSKLTLVVLDSDLELLEFEINFQDRTKYNPRVTHYFRENARTRVIDLPPGESIIHHIDLKYRNLRGGGNARVQVWGFRVGGAPPPPPPPPRPVWDSTGWTMLGERSVNGRVDRDRIDVGRYEGRFSKLTLVVTDSDLELLEFEINFADRTKYNPRVQHYFRENQRTRVIDLPPGESIIHHIDLRYRNLAGGGNARVQVWGLRVGGAPPPPPPPPARVWDSTGWTMLGERTVNGRVDRDRIPVGRYEGRFSKLTIVVLDSDLELLTFQVNFPRGNAYRPAVNHYFRENSRTRVIDLPGDDRTISNIDITYRNLPGGGSARVQVWGFKTTGNVAPAPFSWDNRGWRLIGEQRVTGRVDRDRINVTYDEGRFRQLMIVVLDSDLELLDFDVTFANNTRWSPNARQYFRENTRTRSIDLPGDKRTIRYIDLKYRNLPGGGAARVQVWGK